MILRIAARNILRNTRRSAATLMAIAIGATAMLVFGAFQNQTMLGLTTNVVQRAGHFAIFRRGYSDFGAAAPFDYDLSDYRELIGQLDRDPDLSSMITVVTPTVTLGGIASNYAVDRSKTFFGLGVVPSERDRMLAWNEYALEGGQHLVSDLRDDDPNSGVIGSGLARMLGLCEANGARCPAPPATSAQRGTERPRDFSALIHDDPDLRSGSTSQPQIDLLSATAAGAPNIVKFNVLKSITIGTKEFDDSFVSMHIALAQQLVYGKDRPRVTSIVVQLKHTADLERAMARVRQIARAGRRDIEVLDFRQLTPTFGQIVGMYQAIFAFIALVIGTVVLFSVVNTMSMSVLERTNEIGTSRALGFRRSRISAQFVTEGALLGVIGATLGLLLAVVVVMTVNAAHITWTPPGATVPTPFRLLLAGSQGLMLGVWLFLVALAVLATLLPARRAARMNTVDALRYA